MIPPPQDGEDLGEQMRRLAFPRCWRCGGFGDDEDGNPCDCLGWEARGEEDAWRLWWCERCGDHFGCCPHATLGGDVVDPHRPRVEDLDELCS